MLVKEWWMGLPLLMNSSNSPDTDLPPDPDSNNWANQESRAIEPDFFKKATVPIIEDYLSADGLVHTEHAYTVQRLYNASAYTNETTHRSIFNRMDESVKLLSNTKAMAGRVHAPSRRRLPIARKISGVTANLYGNVASAEGNYFHWFVDSMSSLFLIEQFQPLDEIDQVLVPPLKYDFHWDSLAAFGFDRSKIVELQPLECLQFDCLLASTSPRGKASVLCPGWAIDRYYETLSERAKEVESVAGKRVYISRRDAPARMFLNEDEVCRYFEDRGFDIVELTPLNLWQKIAVFRDADFIVSQTGAGLTNLMFCREGATVLELVDEKFVYPLYASMTVHRGGIHHTHFFENDSLLGRANAWVSRSSIDIDRLDNTIASIE